MGMESRLPPRYRSFFEPGTRPADWTEQPPAWEEIVLLLNEQLTDIRETFTGKLGEPAAVADNPVQARTVADLMHVWIAHESMHAGIMPAMVRWLQHDTNGGHQGNMGERK